VNFPENIWYRRFGLAAACLSPLSLLFALLSALRRLAYRCGLLKRHSFPVPVIVVGNISVGGTGKTPMTLALLARLQAAGWKPGVVSRGYGGTAGYPLLVAAGTTAAEAGDEPCLLAARSTCPVVVDPDRVRAVRYLLAQTDVNVVISDDGMQHYAMGRDIEIAVIDAQRRLGNGWLLPAGPLRESAWRLQKVDAVIVNGGRDDEAAMQLIQTEAVNLADGGKRPLAFFAGKTIHAIAAIGNPQRFFDQLRAAGLEVAEHAFADHHAFTGPELENFRGSVVLMTEKDAVKCRGIAPPDSWYVPVEAIFNARAENALASLLERLNTIRKSDG